MTPSRRSLLAAAARSALLWPAVPALLARPRPARAAAGPQRLVVMLTPNGFLRDRWLPTGDERDFQLGETMRLALEGHKQQLVIVDGLYNQAAERSRGPIAERGMATVLTGRPRDAAGPAGPSLDQAVAALPAGKSFPTLQLGVRTEGRAAGLVTASFADPTQALVPEPSPTRTRERLAMLFQAGGRQPQPGLLAALGATEKNLAHVQRPLGGDERRTLDAHLSGIAELQRQLRATRSQCATPDRAPPDDADLLTVSQGQIDLLVHALACDATRVATLVYEGGAGNALYPGGHTLGHHDAARAARTDRRARDALASMESMLVAQLAYLLGRLRQLDVEGRPLIESTLVLFTSDVARVGGVPSYGPLPVLLAGQASLGLRGGRFLRYSRRPHSDLLLSIYNLFGGAADSFGLGSTGPLPGLFS